MYKKLEKRLNILTGDIKDILKNHMSNNKNYSVQYEKYNGGESQIRHCRRKD